MSESQLNIAANLIKKEKFLKLLFFQFIKRVFIQTALLQERKNKILRFRHSFYLEPIFSIF